MAKEKGGVTLESTIEAISICMPEWNLNNPSTMEAWDLISGTYAEQVSGEITTLFLRGKKMKIAKKLNTFCKKR